MMHHPFVSLTRDAEITEHRTKPYLAQRRRGAEDFSLFINREMPVNEKEALWDACLLDSSSSFKTIQNHSMSILFADQVLVISEKQYQISVRSVSRAKRVVRL